MNIDRYETDWFAIAAKGLYSFDISAENVFELFQTGRYPNCYLIAKVITAAGDFEVGDIIYPQYRDYIGNTASRAKDIAIGIKTTGVLQVRAGIETSLIVNNANGYGQLPLANCEFKIIIEGLRI